MRGSIRHPRRGEGRTPWSSLGRLAIAIGLVALTPRPCAGASARCAHPPIDYGTYSVGTKAGTGKVPLASRLRELRDLGANMIVATGEDTRILDLLPNGMLAVPGCGLMKKRDWQKNGAWDEAQARARLARLAARFARHPRVFGICLTHEVTEYADHARRRWMYRLAKEYFPRKPVIQYYGRLYDRLNPKREKVDGYGLNGEIETDVLFISLQAVRHGRFSLEKVRRLEEALSAVSRTPGIPVWGQTSINADHKYVGGPESMIAVWGEHGENMKTWTDAVFDTVRTDARGRRLRLTGFFWRSLGRFPYDLGYPAFSAHRAQMRAIIDARCGK
jgi:hypothetical protein